MHLDAGPRSTLPADRPANYSGMTASSLEDVSAAANPSLASAPPATRTQAELQSSAIHHSVPQDYIPGGGLFGPRGDGGFRRDADQLPGTEQIAHAPRFAMVAVEQQGIGRRLVNLIGSLSHATDPHCLDVAVWSGMSPQEQLAHDTSPARIAAYTQRYHCVPPPRY